MNYVDFQTFASRLRSNGLKVLQLDYTYSFADVRCWSALINQGDDNIIVHFVVNRYNIGNKYFDVITENKVYTDVYVDDIYDLITNLTKEPLPETIYFTETQNV